MKNDRLNSTSAKGPFLKHNFLLSRVIAGAEDSITTSFVYGTGNCAKLESMRDCLAPLGVGIISLGETGVDVPHVDENGKTPLENARLKALAYYRALNRPVFACDSGLYIDGLTCDEQPGVHVRIVNGKRMSDDEMVAHYANIAKRLGGRAVAQYKNAICLVVNEDKIYEHFGDDISGGTFYLVDKPHPRRIEGFPLDCLSVHIKSGEYYYWHRPNGDVGMINKGFQAFFRKILLALKVENNCPKCSCDLLQNHNLVDDCVIPMKNNSRIIYPKCSSCGRPIQVNDVETGISSCRKVLLISGTAGAGKTALGQLIESRSDYIFIDGDAISKRINHYARTNPDLSVPDYQKETIRTMMVLLSLGYDVVVGYVISPEVLSWYYEELSKYHIKFNFRILVPDRSVCIRRDIERECWTAGVEFVDRWYDEQREYLTTNPDLCIDTSQESLEESFQKHFVGLL